MRPQVMFFSVLGAGCLEERLEPCMGKDHHSYLNTGAIAHASFPPKHSACLPVKQIGSTKLSTSYASKARPYSSKSDARKSPLRTPTGPGREDISRTSAVLVVDFAYLRKEQRQKTNIGCSLVRYRPPYPPHLDRSAAEEKVKILRARIGMKTV